MTERSELLASIANTIKDYRAGEIAEPTPDHVDRWINQFDSDVQVPMLRELDHVFKQTYVSKDRAQRLFAQVAASFPCEFWQAAHILEIQRDGRSQAEIRELFLPILRQRCGPRIDYTGSSEGDFVYLDDAIFTGNRVIEDLVQWVQNYAPPNAMLHIMVIAKHTEGDYWIGQNQTGRRAWAAGKDIDYSIRRFDEFEFENRRAYRDRSDVLWPTTDVYSAEGFQPRNPTSAASKVFSNERGRQLLEREFLNSGMKIQGFAANPNPMLKPLGYSWFNPGFGSLFVTYRNCPNNCPLAFGMGGQRIIRRVIPSEDGIRSSPAKLIKDKVTPMTPVTAIINNDNCRMRTYFRSNSAVFWKVKERYGGLSNMAGGVPLKVNGVAIRTSEALYQACRFPHLPRLQQEIIEQKSPMSAKMKTRPYRDNDSRPDWDNVRVKITRWCLQVKLAQNWEQFSETLLQTGDRDIVEHSRKDDFWGAKPVNDHELVGVNALGRLLMGLRQSLVEATKQRRFEPLLQVEPLPLNNFRLYGNPIREITPPIDTPVAVANWVRESSPRGPYTTDIVADASIAQFELWQDSTDTGLADSESVVLDGLVDLNLATFHELETLPKIGPGLARAVIAHREANGPFVDVEDITAVPGIGSSRYKVLKDVVSVGISS